MPVQINANELVLIRLVHQRFQSMFGELRHIAPLNEQQIAALRVVLRTGGDTQETRNFRMILCKLTYNDPEAARNIFVSDDANALLRNPIIDSLLSKYIPTVRGSFGVWPNMVHESVLWGLAARSVVNPSYPYVVHIPTLRNLLQVYRDQHQSRPDSAQGNAVESVSEMLSGNLTDRVSASTRREISADARGRCYLCSAPKPRGTPCLVCGYTPRAAKPRGERS
jgi:hypothetical protein